jgi:transcriptional regulator with PAS, ATPase and Fis domain
MESVSSLEQLLLDAYLRQDPDTHPVVALNGRTRIVSADAARQLSDEALAALERAATRMVRDGRPEPRMWPVPDADGLVAGLRPVLSSGSVVGAVAVLSVLDPGSGSDSGADSGSDPAAARSPGRGAVSDRRLPGLAGTSLPWRSAVARAAGLAAEGGPLLIEGEPGAGKTALARALHAARPSAFDAAGATPDEARQWLRSLDGTLDGSLGGGPVLLRHLEALDPSAAAALVGFLEERPQARIVATHTPGEQPGPCLHRLVGQLSARMVAVPPLRERPEDIPALLRAFTPRPASGWPPLTWSVEARQALEQHTWPGNVAELALLVRRLADGRRFSGPVRSDELPDAVRGGAAARRLSGLERAERAAILEALSTHGGNKARTAKALGIARATVYRKLRSYGI